MITPSNIVRHELIGLKAMITDSADKGITGTQGKVIDETRNTLTIEVGGREKDFVKEQSVFSFFLPDSRQWVRIDGKILVARPEDRIKKKLDKW